MNDLKIISQEVGYTLLENTRTNSKLIYREFAVPNFYTRQDLEKELTTRLEVMNKNLLHLYSYIINDQGSKEGDHDIICVIY